ncbi:hypothetical protein [Flavobacterium sp. GP15]|uniref:hypothetical protein n=1 Tax=Flavobacterium sp. GP15 TaxID=2758567 RepID=UPI00165E2FE4|nr:hypothetical protein [Flavobacterium sp. GP15]
MKKILISILFLFPFIIFSQEKSSHNYYWNNYDAYETIVAAKNCYVREMPSIQSNLLDSLQLGKKIKVLRATENDLKIKGLNVSWVAIEYENNIGKLVQGFLWKGFLAVGFSKSADYTYLTAIDKIETVKDADGFEKNSVSISVKILDSENAVVGQKTITKNLDGSYFFQNKTIGSLGLTNLENIYRISFSGEACGIPTLYYYFGWNGKSFVMLPEKQEVGDAGVYYYSENFVFPKETGGKPDLIVKQIEEGEYDQDSEKDNTYLLKISKWTETYKWNGENALFISKSKPVKSSKRE